MPKSVKLFFFSTFVALSLSFSRPKWEWAWPAAAPGRLLLASEGRASGLLPSFTCYTVKIHLISRWWTDGKAGRGEAPPRACVAATPGRRPA